MADLKNTEATETQPWAVQEIIRPFDLNDEPWGIEENAPRWPDGVRMYYQDTRVISDTVATVLKTLAPDGQFRDGQHLALEMALADAIVEHGAAPDIHSIDNDHLSLAFLAGVEWGKAAHARGLVPPQSDPWWMSAGGDEEDWTPEMVSASRFPEIVERLRVILDENYPELTEHLDQVQYHGAKPSPELLSRLHYRFVEEVR